MSHNLREALERMRLSSQQDNSKASPSTQATCSRSGIGRRSGALLAAIKSMAADIAAIKLAMAPSELGQQLEVSQRQGPELARAAATTAAANQWGGISQSRMAQTRAKPTGIVPRLQQSSRLPTHAPYAAASLAHLDDMRARAADAAQPVREKIDVSRSRSAAAIYSMDETSAQAAWQNGAPATAPPLPPEWGIRTEVDNFAEHANLQAEEWGGMVLVPGRGRLSPFFSHDVRQAGQQAHTPPHVMGRTVSWAVALEAELESDRNGADLADTW
jgi:hypothetical protein